jgi:hypothetical protein
MKKHLLMSWVFCAMLHVVACGQEKAQNNKKNDASSTSQFQNIMESKELNNKIEFETYGDIIKKSPNYTKNWNLTESLNPNVIHKVRFIDKINTKIFKEYDIAKESPFVNLGINPSGRSSDAGFFYRLLPSDNINEKFLTKDKQNNLKPTRIYSYYQVENRPHKRSLVIAYTLEFQNQEFDIVSTETIVKVFNENGDLIGEIPNISTKIWHPTVTNNGKYVAFLRGGGYNIRLNKFENEGVDIYNVQTGKKISSIEQADKQEISLPVGNDSTIYVDLYNKETEMTEFNVFDLGAKKMYQKEFNLTDKANILREIDDSGLVFYSMEKKEKFRIELKKDFQTIKIQDNEK